MYRSRCPQHGRQTMSKNNSGSRRGRGRNNRSSNEGCRDRSPGTGGDSLGEKAKRGKDAAEKTRTEKLRNDGVGSAPSQGYNVYVLEQAQIHMHNKTGNRACRRAPYVERPAMVVVVILDTPLPSPRAYVHALLRREVSTKSGARVSVSCQEGRLLVVRGRRCLPRVNRPAGQGVRVPVRTRVRVGVRVRMPVRARRPNPRCDPGLRGVHIPGVLLGHAPHGDGCVHRDVLAGRKMV